MNWCKFIAYATVLGLSFSWILVFIGYWTQGEVCLREPNLIVRVCELGLFIFSFIYVFGDLIERRKEVLK